MMSSRIDNPSLAKKIPPSNGFMWSHTGLVISSSSIECALYGTLSSTHYSHVFSIASVLTTRPAIN